MSDINLNAQMTSPDGGSPAQSQAMPDLCGMYFIQALAYIKKLGLKLDNFLYEEHDSPNYTVIQQSIEPGADVETGSLIELKLSTSNPIKFLPSIYQSNDTLKNFLYIFNHILNGITFKLDNIQRYFNPMEAPQDFYKWLASWFSISVEYKISEEKMRYLIKNIVSLYQWRGTTAGLARYLEILTDIRPKIVEDYIPHSEYLIKSNKLVESFILEQKTSKYHFTISFPVPVDHFDFETIKAIYQVVESEKPAHADFYIVFIPEEKEKVKSDFTIGQDIIS